MKKKPLKWLHQAFFIALSVLLLVFPSHRALAKKKNVAIAIIPIQEGSRLSSSKFSWLIRLYTWAMKKQSYLKVIKPHEVQQRLISIEKPTARDLARIKVAKKFIVKGKLLLKYRRYQHALKAFNIASKMTEKARRWIKDPNIIHRLFIYKAISYMGMRNGEKAREYIMRAVQFDPSYTPSTDEFVPQVVNYYNVIKNWLSKRSDYQLIINSVPKKAKVFFDMRYQGVTPFTIPDIPQGKHYLRLEAPGYLTWMRVANLDPKKLRGRKTIKITITLQRDPKALTLNGIPVFATGADIDPIILDRLQAIQQKLDVDYLFMLRPDKIPTNKILRIAIFKRGKRTITYSTLLIGHTRSQHRRVILADAKKRATLMTAHLRPKIRPRPVVTVAPRYRPRPTIPPHRRRYTQPSYRTIRRETPPKRRVQVIRPIRPRSIRRIPKQPPKEEPSEPKAITETWWFWTATVAGVAVVGGTILFLTLPRPPPSTTFIVNTEGKPHPQE